MAANPACPDAETAEKVVNEVWESCFNDTRPFDEVCFGVCVTCSQANICMCFRYTERRSCRK